MSNSAAEVERGTAPAVLVEGDTCWRRVLADRATVLVDAADYFGALRSSLLKAERTIYILGWELNSRTCLRGEGEPADGAPRELGKLLKYLLRRKKHLEIKILLWDHSMFYTPHRELFPRWIFGWRKLRRVQIELDSHLPLGAAHHDKVVVIDDSVAYCGGMDLTLRRWDTQEHRPVEPRRSEGKNKPYVPVHDVQMVVDGEAAAALGQRVRERWEHAIGKPLDERTTDERSPESSSDRDARVAGASLEVAESAAPRADRWPDGIVPQFERVPIGVIRTLGALEERSPEIREVERSTVAAIGRAEKLVYIENQYVTAKIAAEALLARMRANPALEAILVTSREPGGWLEANTMGVGRQQFMALFDEPHLRRRIQFVYPFARGNPGDDEYPAPNNIGDGTFSIHVHAKVLVIDDTFMRIGSSNLNNRSMGFDTECDLGVEASTPEHRRAIAAVRNGLIAEHWGSEPEAVERALASGDPVLEALAALPTAASLTEAQAASPGGAEQPANAGGKRRHRWRARIARAMRGPGRSRPPVERGVAPVEREEPVEGGVVQLLGDPEHAVSAERFVAEVVGIKDTRPILKWTLAIVTVIALIVGGIVAWRYVPDGAGAGITERVSSTVEALRGNPWRVPLVLLIFVAGSIVSFPILVMIGATVIALGPVLGFVCAAVGSMLAATATFGIGRAIGRKPLRRWLGHRAQRLEQQLEGRGIVTVALLRKVPIAPFTIVNMLIGASGLSYREFIAGTAIGMLPGIAAFAIVGDRAMDVWRNPTPLNVTLVGGAIVLWIGVVVGLQHVMNRFSKR